MRLVGVIVLLWSLLSCGGQTGSRCHIAYVDGNALPDPVCTPGAVNPAVTQDNIKDTICKSGWTATIRPRLDRKPFEQAYGVVGGELDHLIPLELGGHPTDPKNLWPEPGDIPNAKDSIENALRRKVCAHKEALSQAQHDIATNWTTALGN